MIFIFGCVCKIRMDNLKDKIIDYKTYRFNIIFFQNQKNHISKSYSNMILDKKTGKVGI